MSLGSVCAVEVVGEDIGYKAVTKLLRLAPSEAVVADLGEKRRQRERAEESVWPSSAAHGSILTRLEAGETMCQTVSVPKTVFQ